MTQYYSNPLPKDRAGNALQEFPAPVRAVASVMMRENAVASSVLALDPNATHVEVNAVGGNGVVVRWVKATETPMASSVWNTSVIASGLGANFDHFIPANSYRKLAIPKETGGLGPGGLAGAQIGSVYGLYQRLAQINMTTTASSVLVVQY